MKNSLNHKSACGVGFIASLKDKKSHHVLKRGLLALERLEHRGGLGDGAGILTEIPWDILGEKRGEVAVATIFAPNEERRFNLALEIFEQTFWVRGLEVSGHRDVPIDKSVLPKKAAENCPRIIQAFIKRPDHCRTLSSFDKLLYLAKQNNCKNLRKHGMRGEFFFASLSSSNIVYKGLCSSELLSKFYLDLQNKDYKTSFCLFHRRFCTNTLSSWDKAQPFRMIAHNGEINTIEGNKSWMVKREKALGLGEGELITHTGTSDSGNLNSTAEALKYRSSISRVDEILALMIPPANSNSSFYKYWGRIMEPWDGPALVAFADSKFVGARLDRNGFRPCRYSMTEEYFLLGSETGIFDIPEADYVKKGALSAGSAVSINLRNGEIRLEDPSKSDDNKDYFFDAHVEEFEYRDTKNPPEFFHLKTTLNSNEEISKVLLPMIKTGQEPIGSMGDTARIAILSQIPRSLFDYFYQDFAQVTNPPLDYIREEVVTDIGQVLGRRPNLFEARELLPPKKGLEIQGAVLSLGQLENLIEEPRTNLKTKVIDITFESEKGIEGFKERFATLGKEVIRAVNHGSTLLILSDRLSSKNKIPLPSLLALRETDLALNRKGICLRTSIIMDVSDVFDSHGVSVLLGFGASAVCPYLSLEMARHWPHKELEHLFPEQREKRFIDAVNKGVLRNMAKMGISVLRSYQGSELFTSLGFSQELLDHFFPGRKSIMGGVGFREVFELLQKRFDQKDVKNAFFYKEHSKEKMGEVHSLTTQSSRLLHQFVQNLDQDAWKSFNKRPQLPTNIRHLWKVESPHAPLSMGKTESLKDILKTFGSGAMSFGSISAESQRDIFLAMKEIGGRSNSGEGGENPYYFTEGVTASIKQMASGRFGVTAEYLVTGKEVQLKMAQGAKPGEGGQLMGAKVSKEIAKARMATEGTDLISPPPMHDIYSIEDLKELIYEIKQLDPNLKVSVKLVSGNNIGAIALGVTKAGADIIQISGGDGGTGAAALMSMKHCGLIWERGLLEVHRVLSENGLREQATLRVDGAIQTAHDVIMGSILGADEFDFGKMLLVAEGCIMARVCEKNTCPAGIATQEKKLKERYKGNKDHIVRYLTQVATDIQEQLRLIGVESLSKLRGKTEYLSLNELATFAENKNLNFDNFFEKVDVQEEAPPVSPIENHSTNEKIIKDLWDNQNLKLTGKMSLHKVFSTERAIGAGINGIMAKRISILRSLNKDFDLGEGQILLKGSAGQGLGVFLVEGLKIDLRGDANDFVGKSMSGGLIIVRPDELSSLKSHKNSIIGNCAFYGATGGRGFISGMAGDRFGVRNSGTITVVEGVGLHACEYMTGGRTLILGEHGYNLGAGMTGGVVYIYRPHYEFINTDYIKQVPLVEKDYKLIENDIELHFEHTKSQIAKEHLEKIGDYVKFLPKSMINF